MQVTLYQDLTECDLHYSSLLTCNLFQGVTNDKFQYWIKMIWVIVKPDCLIANLSCINYSTDWAGVGYTVRSFIYMRIGVGCHWNVLIYGATMLLFLISLMYCLYYRVVKKCTGMQNIHESNDLNVQLNWQTMHVMLFSSKYEQL